MKPVNPEEPLELSLLRICLRREPISSVDSIDLHASPYATPARPVAAHAPRALLCHSFHGHGDTVKARRDCSLCRLWVPVGMGLRAMAI